MGSELFLVLPKKPSLLASTRRSFLVFPPPRESDETWPVRYVGINIASSSWLDAGKLSGSRLVAFGFGCCNGFADSAEVDGVYGVLEEGCDGL